MSPEKRIALALAAVVVAWFVIIADRITPKLAQDATNAHERCYETGGVPEFDMWGHFRMCNWPPKK